MATKKQLNKKIEQLEMQLHTKKYIHILMPSRKFTGKLFLTIFLGFLSFFNFKLILKIWEDYNLGYVFANESEMINYTPKLADLIVLYPIIGQFLLISLTVILFVSLFKKLNSYDEYGLIGGLIFGLIFGLISGFILGFILGLIGRLIFGLIFGFIFGFIFGLILGLILGLAEEFN